MFEKLMFWKKKEDPLASMGQMGLDAQFPGAGQTDFNAGGAVAPGSLDMSGNNLASMNPALNPNMGMEHQTGAFNTGLPGAMPQTTDPFSQNNQIALGNGMSPFAATLPARNLPADPNAIHPRDVELILSRLELIRSEIENVNHRLTFLEQSMSRQTAATTAKTKNWY